MLMAPLASQFNLKTGCFYNLPSTRTRANAMFNHRMAFSIVFGQHRSDSEANETEELWRRSLRFYSAEKRLTKLR